MHWQTIAATICFIGTFLHTSSAERLKPPEIEMPQQGKWPEPVIMKRTGQVREIQCSANGNPSVTYIWTRNGIEVQPIQDEVRFNSQTGLLVLGTKFQASQTGVYQCTASNTQGAAMTSFLRIEVARAEQFPGSRPEDNKEQTINKLLYQKIACEGVPSSYPPPKFIWKRGPLLQPGPLVTQRVVPDDRLVIDPKGNLHILWVEDDDEKTYVCGYHNPIISVDMWHTRTFSLTVNPSTSANPDRAPTPIFHEDVTVMAGSTAVLTCIFSYYSSSGQKLIVTWSKGSVIMKSSTDFTYTIENVPYPTQDKDISGEYVCTASLPGSNTTRDSFVNLKIIAPPQFVKGESLERISIPKGEDAIFQCKTDKVYRKAYQEPTAWLVNSVSVLGCLPTQFECTQQHLNGSSICVPIGYRCDDHNDCPDGSDELNCPKKGCNENQILCNGKCIQDTETCLPPIVCDYPGMSCWINGIETCLPAFKVCNNNEDCDDGRDEEACPAPVEIAVGRYQISSDRTVMRLPNVLLSDNMCVQCVATNDFGTSFADGCLTVIDKITVDPQPNATYNVFPGMYLSINVDATTDSAYASQIDFVWYIYEEIVDESTREKYLVREKLPPQDLEQFVIFSHQEKNLTIAIPGEGEDFTNEEEFEMYKRLTDNRIYQLVVEHPYDRVVLNFTVLGKQISKPVVVPTTAKAASNLWLIAVILGIIVLIALVIFIICMVCRRDPRGAYYVDKKEHEAGNDPEQELKDSGFHDVGRVGDDDYDDKPEMEKISLTESVNQYESDDDITEEYGGDFDMSSKFNEDGSFIGVYTDKKSKSRGTKEATV